MDAVTPALESLFALLMQISVAGGILAAAVWVVFRVMPALPAAARAAIWWLVALKLVVGLLWMTPVRVPVLPAGDTAAVATPRAERQAQASVAATRYLASAAVSHGAARINWRAIGSLLWLVGLAAVAVRAVRQIQRTRRMVSSAVPSPVARRVAVWKLAGDLDFADVPEVRDSDEVDAPMLVGLLHPCIVLPRVRFERLSGDEQRMVLCHELLHVRRRDLWFGLVPALAERLFFFHPLARLTAREYLLAREAACDREVLAVMGVAPREYGQLLLTLGVAPMHAGFAAAGAAWTFLSLKRRIAMLGQTSSTRRAQVTGWVLAAFAVLTLVPITLVGRTVLPRDVPAAAEPAQETASSPGAAVTSPQVEPQKTADKSEDFDFGLVLDGHHNITHGRIDSRALDRLRGTHDRFFWFRLRGRDYTVVDAAAIDRIEALLRPVTEIGAAQGKVGARQGEIGAMQGTVGAKQGEIGARQGALGAKQAQIGAKQGAIGAKQGELGAREARGLTDAERRDVDRERQALDAQMRQLDARMRELDTQMRALDEEMQKAGEPMRELDAKMRELDQEMRVLDGKMREAWTKAEAEVRALAEKLIGENVAVPR